MKIFFSLIICILLISLINFGFSQKIDTWEKIGNGIHESDIRTMAFNFQTNVLYIGTNNALYEYDSNKTAVRRLFQIGGNNGGVNSIFISLENNNNILLATDQGVYQTLNAGKAWKKIFTHSDPLSEKSQSVMEYRGIIYIGTLKGLFQKDEDEITWEMVSGPFLNSPIYQMKLFTDKFYFSTDKDVFEFDLEDQLARQIFSLGCESLSREDEEDFSDEDPLGKEVVKGIDVLGENVFIATTRGIFYRNADFSHWERLPSATVAMSQVTSFCAKSFSTSHGESFLQDIKSQGFFVGTNQGIFYFYDREWRSLYQGMETNNIKFLLASASNIYAATDKGVFFLPFQKIFVESEKNIAREQNFSEKLNYNLSFEEEPTIQEVHQMAIDYAEVSPEKIKKWREQAFKKAWLPDLSVSSSWDKNRTTNDSIWGSYTGGGQSYKGPDDHTYYRNKGTDVSLHWDLGDIIWSSDQTSIDSRSKLMVELRGSILDQVTRIYFERRRLQLEGLSLSKGESVPIELDLRIQELTALIDSLTGGKFSREIEMRKKNTAILKRG